MCCCGVVGVGWWMWVFVCGVLIVWLEVDYDYGGYVVVVVVW